MVNENRIPEAVLGVLLAGDAETVHKGIMMLETADFPIATQRTVFEAIKAAAAEGAVDIVTVGARLPDNIDPIWLSSLGQDAPLYKASFDQYAAMLREERKNREVRIELTKLTQRAADGEDVLQDMQTLIDRMKTIGISTLRPVGSSVMDALDELDKPDTYIGTGFVNLDKIIRGISAGKLMVIGGRPSMGKSTLAMNIAANVILKNHPVLYFTIEDSKNELMRRMTFYLSQTTEQAYRTDAKARAKARSVAEDIADFNMPLYVHEKEVTVSDICSTAWKVKQERGALPLIVVDYLGLITTAASRRNITRTQEIGEITRALKLLAMDIGATVMLCCQLNRDRDGEEPQLSDLRESGAIEQDADIVLFPYREDITEETCEAKITVAKNRNGGTGFTNVIWFGSQFRFATPARQQ